MLPDVVTVTVVNTFMLLLCTFLPLFLLLLQLLLMLLLRWLTCELDLYVGKTIPLVVLSIVTVAVAPEPIATPGVVVIVASTVVDPTAADLPTAVPSSDTAAAPTPPLFLPSAAACAPIPTHTVVIGAIIINAFAAPSPPA